MRDAKYDGDPPRFRIVITRDALSEVARLVRENSVSTGRLPELARTAISGDRFRGRHCARCWELRTYCRFEDRYIPLCLDCARERIERMAGAGLRLPPSVLALYWSIGQQLTDRERRKREELSVRLDDFYRCDRCGCMGQEDNARYWGRDGLLYPLCVECLEICASRIEEFVPPERTEFDFDV